MNIFRKCYDVDLVENNLLYDLNKLGFNQLDGTPFDINGGYYDKIITIHWKKDKNYKMPERNASTDCPVPFGYNSTQRVINLLKPKTNLNSESAILGQLTSYIYNIDVFLNIIFIPLINNGFCLLSYYGNIYNSLSEGNESWYINHPTLPIFSFNDSISIPDHGYRYVNGFIGLKTNLINNPYSYITHLGEQAPQFWSGDGSQEPILIPGVDESEHQDTVSYNNNVCTLAKIPYNSTYINGMYLCTTSPFQDGVSGKTFSFGGRTFIGMYNNLVFEMPNN